MGIGERHFELIKMSLAIILVALWEDGGDVGGKVVEYVVYSCFQQASTPFPRSELQPSQLAYLPKDTEVPR